jgi:hypothetical protein
MLHARKSYMRIQDPRSLEDGGIPANEPVFLLRAKDRAAADTVRFWANLVREMGGAPEMVEAALLQADKMEEWYPQQVPDMPKGDAA